MAGLDGGGAGGEEDGKEEEDGADWDEHDAKSWVAAVKDQAAQEKAGGKKHAGGDQASRGEGAFFVRPSQGEREG